MESLPLSFDPKIFIFSIVNFGILFFVLKKTLFTPVYNILEERKSKIKEGINQIKQATKEKEVANLEKKELIAQTRKESEEIIRKAEKTRKEIIKQGRDEAERLIEMSRKDIVKEKEDLKKEMNVLLIDLVAAASDRALSNISKQENQTKLMEKAILQSLEDSSLDMG